jgi:hypothetical protein
MTTVHSIGAYRVPDGVLSAVQEASRRTGVDFRYMMAKAATESGFDPTVRAATSNATGLYQFIDGTWLEMVRQHGHEYGLGHYARAIHEGPDGRPTVSDPGLRREILELRNDPRLSALMAAEYSLANRAHLERTVGGRIGPTEMYLGHFLGAHGASRFLGELRRDPQQTGAALFPAAAAANRPAFYADGGRALSLQEIYGLFDRLTRRGMAMAGDAPAASGPQLALGPAPGRAAAGGSHASPAAAPTIPPSAVPGGAGFFAASTRPPSFFAGAGPAGGSAGLFASPAAARPAVPGSAAGPGSAGPPAPGERQLSLWTVLTASRTASA